MRFGTLTMLLLIVASTAGCATRPEAIFRDDCDWAEPIRPSRADVLTRETREQIVAHNEIGAKECGWKP